MSSGQYVVFRLGKERFAIRVQHVSTIIRHEEITGVPEAPSFMEGIINLRGTIVPVLSLSRLFGKAPEPVGGLTRIVVSHIQGKTFGLMVDEAYRVTMFEDSEIHSPQHVFGGTADMELEGIAQVKEEMTFILNLERLLSRQISNEKTA